MIFLDKLPIVLTEDGSWAKDIRWPIKPGTILVLPPDAIVVRHPDEAPA